MKAKEQKKNVRSLKEIAAEIRKDWGAKMYFGAKPYVSAMACLDSINDRYICESGDYIVRYFLANASSWRGETARRVKKELNQMLK